MQYKSPWSVSKKSTSWPSLEGDFRSEVAIIGGGISGVSTLYYILMNTNKNVVLLEKNTIASGATGNNAGLAVAAIERPVTELIEEFGLDETKRGLFEIDSGWDELLSINKKIGLEKNLIEIPKAAFGFSSLSILIPFIQGDLIQKQFGRSKWEFFVCDDEEIKSQIPEDIQKNIKYKTHQDILDKLESKDKNYIAAAVRKDHFRGGRMNSSKFCHALLNYLKKQFPNRFSVYENTEIREIKLNQSQIELEHASGKINVQDVIFCTNGYNAFKVKDQKGNEITKLKDEVIPKEGYLAAFNKKRNDIVAYGFLNDTGEYDDVPYWYISFAPFQKDEAQAWAFVGGPEFELSSREQLRDSQSKDSLQLIKKFLKNTYDIDPSLDYFWRGIMGYTKHGLRWVGKDPQYPHLWYNLGCNGIGLLPGIAGAKRISRLMKGEVLEPSIFDPK